MHGRKGEFTSSGSSKDFSMIIRNENFNRTKSSVNVFENSDVC